MTTHHTLGSIAVPRGMVWVDEFDWVPVERAMTYSVTGALLIDEAPRNAGRPITLVGEVDAGWVGRGVVVQLHALASATDATYTLTLADGRSFAVVQGRIQTGDTALIAFLENHPEFQREPDSAAGV